MAAHLSIHLDKEFDFFYDQANIEYEPSTSSDDDERLERCRKSGKGRKDKNAQYKKEHRGKKKEDEQELSRLSSSSDSSDARTARRTQSARGGIKRNSGKRASLRRPLSLTSLRQSPEVEARAEVPKRVECSRERASLNRKAAQKLGLDEQGNVVKSGRRRSKFFIF
jgi:hypothetical protein